MDESFPNTRINIGLHFNRDQNTTKLPKDAIIIKWNSVELECRPGPT
jgi:hypothetical protein